jgi:hypothetical protein
MREARDPHSKGWKSFQRLSSVVYSALSLSKIIPVTRERPTQRLEISSLNGFFFEKIDTRLFGHHMFSALNVVHCIIGPNRAVYHRVVSISIRVETFLELHPDKPTLNKEGREATRIFDGLKPPSASSKAKEESR